MWTKKSQIFKLDLEKARRPRAQIANIHWIIEKAKEFKKNIYFCFIDYAKAFDCVDHNKLWKIFKETGIPTNLSCLLRNLYEGQEATVKRGHDTTDWFQIGEAVHQGCILSPCLFNVNAEYIMWNVGLNETQAGSKIARRTIINLRYADDTTLIWLDTKITADGDYSHEINRCLLLGRKVMNNLDSILKSRKTTFSERSLWSKLWFFQ